MTEAEALALGFTHVGRYWCVPVYLGDIEFAPRHPIKVMPFNGPWGYAMDFFSLLEWALTPPNTPSNFTNVREIGK